MIGCISFKSTASRERPRCPTRRAICDPVVESLHPYIRQANMRSPDWIGALLALEEALDHLEDVGRWIVVDALPILGMIRRANASVEPSAKAPRDRTLGGARANSARARPRFMAPLIQSTGAAAEAAIAAASTSDCRVVADAMYEVPEQRVLVRGRRT